MGADAGDTMHVGGTVNVFSWGGAGGIGVMTGTIDGTGYSEVLDTSDLGNGRFRASVKHYFLDRDGSVIHTRDIANIAPDPAGDPALMYLESEYTLVWATGRFKEYEGSFRSRGWVRSGGEVPDGNSYGGLRYWGTLCRKK